MNAHDEMAIEVRVLLVKTGDTTLGTISHRTHISCPVLIQMLEANKESFWFLRKAPARESDVGLTSVGMAKASEEQ